MSVGSTDELWFASCSLGLVAISFGGPSNFESSPESFSLSLFWSESGLHRDTPSTDEKKAKRPHNLCFVVIIRIFTKSLDFWQYKDVPICFSMERNKTLHVDYHSMTPKLLKH